MPRQSKERDTTAASVLPAVARRAAVEGERSIRGCADRRTGAIVDRRVKPDSKPGYTGRAFSVDRRPDGRGARDGFGGADDR